MKVRSLAAAACAAALAGCVAPYPAQGGGQGGYPSQYARVTMYQDANFSGRSFETDAAVSNFAQQGFNDRASSLVIQSGRWELCSDADYRGRCVVLGPGRYESLAQMGLNDKVSSIRREGGGGSGGGGYQRSIVFFEHDDFQGRQAAIDASETDFRRIDFNDAASSVIVARGTWQVCTDADYRGRCVTLGPGRYNSLRSMGLNDAISSARRD